MSCSTACPTRDHESYGACLRAKSLRIGYCGQGGGDATTQKRWDAELDAYRSAVSQGIQPETTKIKDIRKAVEVSEQTGKAYRAEKADKGLS